MEKIIWQGLEKSRRKYKAEESAQSEDRSGRKVEENPEGRSNQTRAIH